MVCNEPHESTNFTYKTMKLPSRINIIRTALFIAASLILFYLFPHRDIDHYTYEMGKPWNYSLLTAPSDIPIYLDSISAQKAKDSIDSNFIPVYKRLTDETQSTIAALSTRINTMPACPLNAAERNRLIGVLNTTFANGIVDQSVYSLIHSDKLPYIRFIKGNTAVTESTSSLRSPRMAYAYIDSLLPGSAYHKVIEAISLAENLSPNVVVDSLASDRLRDDSYQKALAPIGIIQKGERIIDRGDIVTPQLFTLLHTYEQTIREKSSTTSRENIYRLLGQLLYVVTLLIVLYTYLRYFRPAIFGDARSMLFIMVLITAFTIFAFALAATFHGGLYLAPFVVIPIMIQVFFDSRTALFCHIIVVLFCAIIATAPLEFLFMQIIAGQLAVNSLKDLSRRSQLLQTALVVFATYSVAYIAIDVVLTGTIDKLSIRSFCYFGINSVLISFAYVLIFVFEKLFGFTSKVTLVELSDINNPLLRELSEECPGTFQHSMQVSNLAAEAAHRIGADVLLVRAGALYHDIGKISNPAFFTENQHGVNPHDALNPTQSARVVISHVTDGLKRADRFKLPAVIKDFISQHHGRGKAKYFYNTYCNSHPGEDVDAEPFTYPGPNPTSKETSILMMADAVEAASRSLSDHSPEAIASLVDRIIDSQIADGLLQSSPLSFRDISEIKASFCERLRTIYHARVSYPENLREKKSATTPSA